VVNYREEIGLTTSWHTAVVGVLFLAKICTSNNTDSGFIRLKYAYKNDLFVVRSSMCVSTVIDGLDALIEGGFFRGSVILVNEGKGSGKTILLTQFIYNGATNDDVGGGRRR
jgi:predicted ATP-dependent serine protease